MAWRERWEVAKGVVAFAGALVVGVVLAVAVVAALFVAFSKAATLPGGHIAMTGASCVAYCAPLDAVKLEKSECMCGPHFDEARAARICDDFCGLKPARYESNGTSLACVCDHLANVGVAKVRKP